uniref:Secreted frizzled related protein 1/5 n=1 Tax=Meara stichopi TaxID=84115 RepID=A0A2P1DVC1_9BILA|nr:secreted frizzled related protein 1/5 [Meara stichopi]
MKTPLLVIVASVAMGITTGLKRRNWNVMQADETRRIVTPQCVDIPSEMTLCQGMDYNQMRMPNAFNHDTIVEAFQQANAWLPLVESNCHNDTQMFLCSLFAPVCLPEVMDRDGDMMIVYPCQSFCKSVHSSSCINLMKANNVNWPASMECSQYPTDTPMCIRPPSDGDTTKSNTDSTEVQGGWNLCSVCKEKSTISQEDIGRVCNNDEFVVRIKVKKVIGKGNHIRIVSNRNIKVFRKGELNETRYRAKKFTVYMKDAKSCQECKRLISTKRRDQLVITGFATDKKYYATNLYQWSNTVKKDLRGLRKTCK